MDIIDVVSGESIEVFSYFLTLLPYTLNPAMDNALVIGLGAGLVPNWLEKRGIQPDAVDIDPAVFVFAERYFNAQLSGRKVKQDARYFLQKSQDIYGLVVLDAFTGDITPGHLVSLEALQLVENRLADQGILEYSG